MVGATIMIGLMKHVRRAQAREKLRMTRWMLDMLKEVR